MEVIHVKLPKQDHSYKISIEEGLFRKIPTLLKKTPLGNRYAIISDKTVAKLYGETLLQNLQAIGIEAVLLTFPSGERSKNLQTVEKLLINLLKKKFTRKDAILALGGGVTGDLASFTASIFMRGISYAHIPTTLLAMVDSSIGGKTGVNLTIGKNLAGTFYQPQHIWVDPQLLKTLPKEQYLNGFAEIIKYAIINDSSLFSFIENNIQKNKKTSNTTLNKLIIRSAKIKAKIITKDEKENGLRMILNYGHTIGHAIERLSNYKIEHGRAVGLGIFLINKIALELGIINKKDTSRINNLLDTIGVFQKPAGTLDQVLQPEKLWKIMQSDKKMQESKINFIIAKKIGYSIIYNKINKQMFLKHLPKKVQ